MTDIHPEAVDYAAAAREPSGLNLETIAAQVRARMGELEAVVAARGDEIEQVGRETRERIAVLAREQSEAQTELKSLDRVLRATEPNPPRGAAVPKAEREAREKEKATA